MKILKSKLLTTSTLNHFIYLSSTYHLPSLQTYSSYCLPPFKPTLPTIFQPSNLLLTTIPLPFKPTLPIILPFKPTLPTIFHPSNLLYLLSSNL